MNVFYKKRFEKNLSKNLSTIGKIKLKLLNGLYESLYNNSNKFYGVDIFLLYTLVRQKNKAVFGYDFSVDVNDTEHTHLDAADMEMQEKIEIPNGCKNKYIGDRCPSMPKKIDTGREAFNLDKYFKSDFSEFHEGLKKIKDFYMTLKERDRIKNDFYTYKLYSFDEKQKKDMKKDVTAEHENKIQKNLMRAFTGVVSSDEKKEKSKESISNAS